MEEEIRKLIEKFPIFQKISEEALNISKKIEDEPFSEEDKARASVFLACDENSCAMIRKIPKPNYKILKRARKKTGIKPNIEAINWVDSICREINKGENVARTAKEILREYRKRNPADYYRYKPLTNAVAAVYIAGILCNEHIPQGELGEPFGIPSQTIRKRYKEIARKLGDYIDTQLLRYL